MKKNKISTLVSGLFVASVMTVITSTQVSAEDNSHHSKGAIMGWIFEDTNENSYYEPYRDRPLPDVQVKVTDRNDQEYSTHTNHEGIYYIMNVEAGSVKVEVVESTLPSGFIRFNGTNPTIETVRRYHTKTTRPVGYIPGDGTATLLPDFSSTVHDTTITFSVTKNDENVLVNTVSLSGLPGGADVEQIDTDNDGDFDKIIVKGEGTWIVDEEGNITFDPLPELKRGFGSEIKYSVNGNNKVTESIIVIIDDA